jgi:hypothetical protein
MARVSDAEVKAILDTTLDTAPFIAAATLLVDRHLADQGLDSALLKEIERWLAAWLVCARDPRFTQVSTEGQSMTLAAQDYWTQVQLLDPTGRLVQAVRTQRASILIN